MQRNAVFIGRCLPIGEVSSSRKMQDLVLVMPGRFCWCWTVYNVDGATLAIAVVHSFLQSFRPNDLTCPGYLFFRYSGNLLHCVGSGDPRLVRSSTRGWCSHHALWRGWCSVKRCLDEQWRRRCSHHANLSLSSDHHANAFSHFSLRCRIRLEFSFPWGQA